MHNTVEENLSFFAEIKEVPQAQINTEIERVLTKVGLTLYRKTLAINLSGGYKRRLNVAIAILGNPNIIIMDEPTSGILKIHKIHFLKDC